MLGFSYGGGRRLPSTKSPLLSLSSRLLFHHRGGGNASRRSECSTFFGLTCSRTRSTLCPRNEKARYTLALFLSSVLVCTGMGGLRPEVSALLPHFVPASRHFPLPPRFRWLFLHLVRCSPFASPPRPCLLGSSRNPCHSNTVDVSLARRRSQLPVPIRMWCLPSCPSAASHPPAFSRNLPRAHTARPHALKQNCLVSPQTACAVRVCLPTRLHPSRSQAALPTPSAHHQEGLDALELC